MNNTRLNQVDHVLELAFRRQVLVEKQNGSKAFHYWIVGRLYPPNKTLFVCYEDAADLPINIVNWGFSLATAMGAN
jgi:hypothetical protein